MIVFLNGKLVPEKKAVVSVTDHGFLYGDGVYETIRVYNGRPFLLGEHLRRLNNSLQGIRLSSPLSLMQFGLAVQKTIETNKHKDAVVRITVTRGPGPYGFDPVFCTSPSVVITSTPVHRYPAEHYKKGILAAVVSVRRNSEQALPPVIKSTSCLNGILAKIESQELGAQEAIMMNQSNFVEEGSVSNVFVVNKRAVMTPRNDGGLLPGVTRDWVCRLALEAGYTIEEKKIPVTEMLSADEMFLTNSIMEIMPVSRVVLNVGPKRQFRFGPYARTSGYVGPVTLDLMARFKKSIKRFENVQ